MSELFRINQQQDLVPQLNQILRRISERLDKIAVASQSVVASSAGLTEGRVVQLISAYINNTGFGDLSNYAFLPGRSGGQSLYGGEIAGQELKLGSNLTDISAGNVEVLSPLIISELNEDVDNISGLTWAYKAGNVRQGITVNDIAASTIVLTSSATNYVELEPATGVISNNIIGFTVGKVPIRQLDTDASSITASADKRSFIHERDPVRGAFVWTVSSTAFVSSNASHILRCVSPNGVEIEKCLLDIKTAPEGDSLICDIKANGVSLFSTAGRPQIASSATSGNSTTFSMTSLANEDLLTFEISQVGSTVSGTDLTASLKVKQKR